ncbi:MAG: hypothetical protein ACTHLY_04215, partial [Pseudolabrys sp.]
MNEVLLQEIATFCRQRGLAESTFGRRAVNDGKLAARLRNGGRITTDTLERIRSFMAEGGQGEGEVGVRHMVPLCTGLTARPPGPPRPPQAPPGAPPG